MSTPDPALTAALKAMLTDACWRCSDGDGATCDPCLSELVAAAERDAGARLRNEWVRGRAWDRTYIHRDDLPPTDPDAELVEAIAFALYQEAGGLDHPRMSSASDRDHYLPNARAALAVVREHEAKS